MNILQWNFWDPYPLGVFQISSSFGVPNSSSSSMPLNPICKNLMVTIFCCRFFFFFESKITQSKHFMKKVLCQNYKVNRNSLSAFLHPNYQQELPCTTFAGPYIAIKNPTMSLPVGFLVLIQACRGSDNENFLL